MNQPPLSNYRWVMVGVLWLVHCATYMNIAGLGTLAPYIKADLALSSFQFGLLISAVSIGSAFTQMPAGLLSDAWGARIMLTAAVASIGSCIALFSLSPGYALGLLVLLFYGGGTGIVGPSTSKSVMDWFPPIGRATAMGIKQTGVNFGGIFAGLLFPFLATMALTWRQSFLAVGLCQLATALLIYRLAKEPPVTAAFKPPPVAWRSIFRMAGQRDILLLGAVAFCFMACQFCFSTYLILFLTQEMGHTIVQAGRYFALAFLLAACGRIVWSLVSDYLLAGRRKGILRLVALILLVASFGLGMLSFRPSLAIWLTVLILAYGVSGIGWNALYLTLLGESVERNATGLATGAGYFYGFLGSVAAPPLFGLLVDRTGGYGWAWLMLSGLAAAILVLLCFYTEKRPRAAG